MNTIVLNDIQKLSLDAYNGKAVDKYSVNEMNTMLRAAITEACGGEWNFYKFQKNKWDVYAIVAQSMPVALKSSLDGAFGDMALIKDTALGDKNYFTTPNNDLFKVYTVARGNYDVERQTIVSNSFSIATQKKLIKIYTEIDLFIAGKIDWVEVIARVTKSFGAYVGELIYSTIYNSYSAIGTSYKQTGAFDASTMLELCSQVQNATGTSKVQIFGTQIALANIADGAGYSDAEKRRFNEFGFYDMFRGNSMYMLPQAYEAGTTTKAVNDASVFILPDVGTPIVNVVMEGDPEVRDNDGTSRNDGQPEFLFGRMIGAAALTVEEGLYGMYKFI
jgi:hypothetical protein